MDELGDLWLGGIANDPSHSGKCGQLVGGALGVATGDDDTHGGVGGVKLSDGIAGLGIGGGRDGAGVDDHDVGGLRPGGRGTTPGGPTAPPGGGPRLWWAADPNFWMRRTVPQKHRLYINNI